MPAWYIASPEVLDAWPDAPVENAALLGMLLDVAKEQVLAFAPEYSGDVEDDIEAGRPALDGAEYIGKQLQHYPESAPARYVYAQLQQAKNLYNAGRVTGSEGSAGAEGFTFVPRPLDRTIRQMIRPQSGVASVL